MVWLTLWVVIILPSISCKKGKRNLISFFSLQGTKLVYKHLATLYFVFAFDSSENELAMLDLVQGNLNHVLAPFFFSYYDWSVHVQWMMRLHWYTLGTNYVQCVIMLHILSHFGTDPVYCRSQSLITMVLSVFNIDLKFARISLFCIFNSNSDCC
jgi:hypothetical protein